MTYHNRQYSFTERIMYLLQFLEENHAEIDQISESDSLFDPVASGDKHELKFVLESIRFMDEIPGGFFIYRAGDNKEIIYANRGVLRIFKCDTLREFREFTGNSFKGMIHPDDLQTVENSILKSVAGERHDTDYVEYRIRRRDGVVRWVENYGHFDHIEPFGDIFLVFIGDPADERSLQQMEQAKQRQILVEALEKANLAVKAKNDFLSHISHEMRTPLNAAFGFTSLAKNSLHDTDIAREYLEQVEIANRQLLDMITKALDVAILSDAAEAEREICDLQNILQEVCDSLRPRAQEKSIIFTLDCGQSVRREIYASSKRLRQLSMNLIDNAISYTNAHGQVDVILTEEKPLPDNYMLYRLDVRDTGVGISEEFLNKLFEPFSRAKEASLSGVRGIGLGLTIVKSIADLLGGTVAVKSSLNQGSTFTVTLPLQISPPEDHAGGQETDACPGLRILLAEDNEINREIQTELLEQAGFIVEAVTDGRQALDRLRQSAPGDFDLLLMDLQMPVMDGWQAAAAIRKLPDPALAGIPIFALSANAGIDDRRRSLESGIDIHLTKPMDVPILLNSMKDIIRKHNENQLPHMI